MRFLILLIFLVPTFVFSQTLEKTNIQYVDATDVNTFEELMKPFEGKVVYIDLWASWCGPCRAQLSQKDKLKEAIKGKDVVLLYLSTEKSDEPWKKAIEELNIEGQHLRLTGALRADLKKHFYNRGLGPKYFALPTYVIVDRHGKVVYRDAARPNDTRMLKRQLKKALKR